jgi:hypothetical protein
VFEVIKLFVESVIKLINVEALVKERDKKRLSKIGVELFSLYATLNSIYVTGKRIQREIESTIDRADRYKAENRFEGSVGSYDLDKLLSAQVRNIASFSRAFDRLTPYLSVIDPLSAQEVSLFLATKISIIGILIRMMKVASSQGGVKTHVFSPSLEDEIVDKVRFVKSVPFSVDYSLNATLLAVINSGMNYRDDESVVISHITDEKLAFLKKYLETRNPSRELERLREILDSLHENLINNFEIKDILIGVGEVAPQDSTEEWAAWHNFGRGG